MEELENHCERKGIEMPELPVKKKAVAKPKGLSEIHVFSIVCLILGRFSCSEGKGDEVQGLRLQIQGSCCFDFQRGGGGYCGKRQRLKCLLGIYASRRISAPELKIIRNAGQHESHSAAALAMYCIQFRFL